MGWPLSDQAVAKLADSTHTAVSRIDILHGGLPVYSLDVISGDVTADSSRSVRWNLSCVVVDPTGDLTNGNVGDLLNPYQCEIKAWRGVRADTSIGAMSDEWVPLGVYMLTSRDMTSDGQITLTGQDRTLKYQGPMENALSIPGGTAVEVAVIKLLAARNPGISLLTMQTGFTCGPLLYSPDIDCWAEALKLAQSVGGQLYHDRVGQCCFLGSGPSTRSPVASYTVGDGLLLTAERVENSDSISNVVIAESQDGSIRAVAEDDDTSSPTYANGPYGRRVKTISNAAVTSVAQAQQAATADLIYELGRSETTTFTAVPDPRLDVNEMVTVNCPTVGLAERGLVIAALQMPLTATEAMTVTGVKSVLAPDGQILPAQLDTGSAA